MEAAKIGWFLLSYMVGVPLYIYAFIRNIESVKSTVLFILAVIFLLVRMYYYVKKNNQALREKEYDLWEREENKRFRQHTEERNSQK